MTSKTPAPRRPTGEGGFTLAASMGIMLIASIVCLAAFQAANGDLVPSGENRDRKAAIAAAESGAAWYQAKLNADPNYWQLCDTGTTNGVADPVNQKSVSKAARKWRTLSGTGKEIEDFSLTMMPISPATACSTSDPNSMISSGDGSFKVKSTGRYHGEVRSIITSFRRARFLDFLYFTDYETLDPDIFAGGNECRQYRAARPSSCTTIQFAGNDRVNGPLHTNDDLIYCGSPVFGRGPADNVHVSGPPPGYARNSSCGTAGTPTFRGTFRTGQQQLTMPPTNAALRTLTSAGTTGQGYRFSGETYIRFTGATMTVDTPGGNPTSVALPPNGVIFVDDAGCTPGQLTVQTTSGGGTRSETRTPQYTDYNESTGCGNVYVSGTANKSVTVASARDIIIAPTLATTSTTTANQFNPRTAGNSGTPASNDTDLIASGTFDSTTHQITGLVNIGLIADGYVRVYHRVGSFPIYNPGAATLASSVRDVRIDAAILSLQHSFIVDNWAFGPAAGTLTEDGVIAQKFRGPVGTGNGATISTGYVKDYWYDNRLRYRSPPYFLDPIGAGWEPGRQNEVVPAL